MRIELFFIEYDANNSKNTFTNGDTVRGRIIVQVSKKTRIQSLIFRVKGEAKVRWTEGRSTMSSNEAYYDEQRHILTNEVISPGRHCFTFTFKIPDRDMPSSLQAFTGKVVHQLGAQLKQPMRLTKNTKAMFTFVPKPNMVTPMLMEPQYGCKDQSVTFFASGNISLNVFVQKMGYRQGEALNVVAKITNCSTRTVKPKFFLYKQMSFMAQGRRRVYMFNIVKNKGEQVGSSYERTVTKTISIPRQLPPSNFSCSIIKLEYRLKVLLDVSMAKNPEVILPIVILSYNGSGTNRSDVVKETTPGYL